MHAIDYTIIVIYFAIVIGIGFWYQRRASKSLDSYFLGGKSMHWLAMAMSGSVSTFDITGTMWIVTLITLFGMKSMWNHWMWGFLMAAFFMSYMGKWVRRSNVMTGAEWMVTRFGPGPDGQVARIAYTLMAVVTLTGFVGYAFQGIGKFATVYIDLKTPTRVAAELFPGYSETIRFLGSHEAELLALIVFAITTLYVLLGGLYGVVITNVIQTVVLTMASLLIAAVAYSMVTPELLAERLPAGWNSLWPTWRLTGAEHALVANTDYVGYELFGALVIVWVVKGLLLNLGGPGQMYDFQIFLAARHPRDAAKLGAAWSAFLIVRWAMCMGIALLFLTGLVDTQDQEQVMPIVLQRYLWTGVRGVVIAGLLAAFMSTFSATVNAAASYIVRDLWQRLVRPNADQRHLVRASYVATLAVVIVGTAIGFHAESIRQVWDWIMMAVGGAFVIPNVMRWYWWRLNGYGYAIGTLVGMVASLIVPFVPALSLPYVAFPLVCGLSAVGCLAGTWWTRPTDEDVLTSFYRSVRPFGFWGPIRRRSGLSAAQLADRTEGLPLAAANVVLSSVVILGTYLAPMYLVAHWHATAAACFGMAAAAGVTLYFTWYRTLPEAES
ncbi:MAG: hypothetical protein JXB62_15150 [Pirellulales bacterium]|nr:hypothetical protein [Pirellulales bacterium]